MVHKHSSTLRIPALGLKAAGLVALMLLSGCATASNDGTSDLKLVDTKSPVQLLRNNALDRVDSEVVSEVRETADESAACFTDDGNPGELIRQWRSSGEAVLVEGTNREEVTEKLIQSFTADGWNDSEISGSFALTVLDSDSSVAAIEVSSVDVADVGVIRISVTGPCVRTAGPDSDEVKALEAD